MGMKCEYQGRIASKKSGVKDGRAYFIVEVATWGNTFSPRVDADQYAAIPEEGAWIFGTATVEQGYKGVMYTHISMRAATRKEVLEALFIEAPAAPKAAA